MDLKQNASLLCAHDPPTANDSTNRGIVQRRLTHTTTTAHCPQQQYQQQQQQQQYQQQQGQQLHNNSSSISISITLQQQQQQQQHQYNNCSNSAVWYACYDGRNDAPWPRRCASTARTEPPPPPAETPTPRGKGGHPEGAAAAASTTHRGHQRPVYAKGGCACQHVSHASDIITIGGGGGVYS